MVCRILSVLWGYRVGGVTNYVKSISKNPHLEITTAIFHKKVWGDAKRFQRLRHFKVFSVSGFGLSIKLFEFVRFWKEYSPDLVYAHSFNGGILTWFTKIIFRLNTKIVYSYHGPYIAPKRYKILIGYIFNYLIKFIYKYSDCEIICVSKYSRDKLVEAGVKREKINVVYNGISGGKDERRDRGGALEKFVIEREGKLCVGVVSRLVPLKGVDVLIEAVCRLDSVLLVIIGDGPEKKNLKNLADETQVGTIRFVGEVQDVDRWLNEIDIFCLPSFEENHSIALLEAMRAGKAIICTNVGGNPETIIDGEQGILVEPGDVDGLSNSLRLLMKDRELRVRLGENAKRRFDERFTLEVMQSELAEVLNRIIQQK